MDIEGSEFSTLVALIDSFEGRPLPFGQLQLEIHFGYTASQFFKKCRQFNTEC
jgi:hypothetical protein